MGSKRESSGTLRVRLLIVGDVHGGCRAWPRTTPSCCVCSQETPLLSALNLNRPLHPCVNAHVWHAGCHNELQDLLKKCCNGNKKGMDDTVVVFVGDLVNKVRRCQHRSFVGYSLRLDTQKGLDELLWAPAGTMQSAGPSSARRYCCSTVPLLLLPQYPPAAAPPPQCSSSW